MRDRNRKTGRLCKVCRKPLADIRLHANCGKDVIRSKGKRWRPRRER